MCKNKFGKCFSQGETEGYAVQALLRELNRRVQVPLLSLPPSQSLRNCFILIGINLIKILFDKKENQRKKWFIINVENQLFDTYPLNTILTN
jgi:plastocyanin domain-containing protein